MTDIEQVLAIAQIRALKASYCRLLDTKKWDEWGKVFALDCAMDVSDDVKEGMGDPIIRGRDIIVGQTRRLVGHSISVHQVHEPEIEMTSATTAKGVWGMYDLIVFPEGSGAAPFRMMQGFGHYHETYENLAGRWHIKSIKLTRLHRIIT